MVDKTQTELMRKYLSPDISNIREVEKNVALMFTNCHHTFSGVRPLSPAIISIAGLHVEQNTDELPLVKISISIFKPLAIFLRNILRYY